MIPPSPAAFVASVYPRNQAVVVNCHAIHRYRDYECVGAMFRKTKPRTLCAGFKVHWNGERWVIVKFGKAKCPLVVIRIGGSLFALKA